MPTTTKKPPKTPPPWFMHFFWKAHRGIYKVSGGRFLWTPGGKRGWGAVHLTATGRKSGEPRSVILGYLEDGDNLVVEAMNGMEEGDPAWWLNLQANPDAVVRQKGQEPRPVRAHEATGEERERLWELWKGVEPDLDAYAEARDTKIALVVLAPR